MGAYIRQAGLDAAEHPAVPVPAMQRETLEALIEAAGLVGRGQPEPGGDPAELHRRARAGPRPGRELLRPHGRPHRRDCHGPPPEDTVIGKVLKRGSRVCGVLRCLYPEGRACVHSSPHLVPGWRHPAEPEPPLDPGGHRDLRMLAELLEHSLSLPGDRAQAAAVSHCEVRAAPGDPDLGDGAWMRIAGEIMHRTGLSGRGEEDEAALWVAVYHGGNHIHIAAALARQDGRPAWLRNDFCRIGEALRDIEAGYGLQVVARAGRTAAKRPARAAAGDAVPPGGRRRGCAVGAGVLRGPGTPRAAGPAAARHPPAGRGDRVRGRPGRRHGRGRGADLVRRRQAGTGPDPAQAAAPLAGARPPGAPAAQRRGRGRTGTG